MYLTVPGLSCAMWDFLVLANKQLQHAGSSPRTGLEPGPPALGVGSLGCCITREDPQWTFLSHFLMYGMRSSPSQTSAVHEPWTSRCSRCFRKDRGTNCQHLLDHRKSKRISEKHLFLLFLTMSKPLTVWITVNCGQFWRRWAYQTTWPASWETCMQVRKRQLELDMEGQTGSK